jgi:hypothetical protein
VIVKEPHQKTATHASVRAGQRQESDVAFYLRRELGEARDVFVFNDLQVTHNGENAQIDHLVLHRCGFILIESKSIRGEVTVNARGEWSRGHRGRWSGMKSPLRQAELQKAILHDLLAAHYDQLLGTIAGIQKKVSASNWWAIRCAVSSDAIVHRQHMPKQVSESVLKAEFLGEEVAKILRPARSTFTAEPRMGEVEVAAIRDFLLAQAGVADTTVAEAQGSEGEASADELVSEAGPGGTEAESAVSEALEAPIVCKQCGAKDGLEAKYGRYGYYVVCGACQVNTSMKRACPACESRKTWVNKNGTIYTLSCRDCASQARVFTAT